MTFVGGRYVDVTFPTGPTGASIDATSVTGDEIAFVVNNGHSLAVDTTRAPVRDAINASTFRYFVTGTAVSPPTRSPSTSSPAPGRTRQRRRPRTTPTDLGSLAAQTTITVDAPGDRRLHHRPRIAHGRRSRVRAHGDGPGHGDDQRVGDDDQPDDRRRDLRARRRYVLRSTGTVSLALVARSWSYIPTTAPGDQLSTLASGHVDVTFPVGPSGAPVDPTSITGNEVTFVVNNGHSLTVSGTPTATGDPRVFRFAVTGTAVSTDTIVAHLVTGTWSYTAPAAQATSFVAGNLSGQTTIDVALPSLPATRSTSPRSPTAARSSR